jgi:hypothetical protein
MPNIDIFQLRWRNGNCFQPGTSRPQVQMRSNSAQSMAIARLSAILLGVGLSVLPAQARTINAASTSQGDVAAAVGSASVGDTVNIPSGTSTWNSPVFVNKGIFIFGAGSDNTHLINGTSSRQGLEIPLFQIQLSAPAPVRISGIYLQNSGDDRDSDGIDIFPTSFIATQVVIDNCTFEGFSFAMKNEGDFGVCYSCSFLNNKVATRNSGYANSGALQGFSPPPYPWNSTNYFVWEDCTFALTNWSIDTYMGDTDSPMNYMVRHCTFNIDRSATITADGFDMHGNDGTAVNSLGLVIDDNTFNYTGNNVVNPCRLVDIRGGVGSLVYNNTATGVNLYATLRADPAGSVAPANTYLWNNTGAGGSSLAISTDDNVTQGVNFFLSQPSNYTPLQYPHPLRSGVLAGGGGGGGNPVLASPSGLRIVPGGR